MIPLHHLSDIDSFDFSKDIRNFPVLPHVKPFFFVPPLEDKPQNPIMDNLKIEEANSNMPKRTTRMKIRIETEVEDPETSLPWSLEETKRKAEVELLWTGAAKQKTGVNNELLSWDRLRATHPTKASRTAFLSEQDEYMWSAARYHVQPLLRDPTYLITTTTHHELLISLKTTVLGISSQLHIWDSNLERFLQVGTEKQAKVGILLVDGKDNVVSQSFTTRFITIGTLLRRLELLLSTLRTRSAKEGPTIHSLAHSLSATLDYVRQKLMECPPSNTINEQNCLTQIWSYFAPYEELLVALADLCGRSEFFKTTEYLHLESDPVPLLSRLYEHLNLHFERQSSHLIRSVMAYILSGTSHEYIQHVAHSIGFGGQPKPQTGRLTGVNDFEEVDDEEDDLFDLLDTIETRFPEFFPPKMLSLLPAAQKSLVLLKVAQPDHALLVNGTGNPVSKTEVRWLWGADEVEAVWNGLPLPSPIVASIGSEKLSIGPSEISYSSELSAFRVFDLEPGVVEFIGNSSNAKNCTSSSAANLSSFISSFPPSLPSITPTLSSLVSLTFQRLTEHASTLSTALLRIFIDQSGKLNFCTHLILLRDFLLVSKPEFKSKLIIALFDDAGEFRVSSSSAHSLSVRAVRQRMRELRHGMGHRVDKQRGEEDKDQGSKMPWAVGLAPHLLERQTWPPVGSDLAFYLRTVIVDSLDWNGRENKKDDNGEVKGEGTMTKAIVLEEAEWRLGFAIKELAVGSGKEKWMDPLSVEALDFLYMDYKPPRPLEILISPEILSKYQRMFEFILRLLRVENALKSLFRMSVHRLDGTFLFPTLAKSRQLLLHFRFVAQAFVSGLSGYVFDTAIRGNFDPFLSQLNFSLSTQDSRRPSFSDVFELAQCHSALLNDILSACMLRSGQKGLGDLLRHSMEIVLEFAIVVGDLQRERMEEYQASPIIEELYKKFCVKMTMLAKVLKGLIDKSPSRPTPLQDYYVGGSQRPTGGLEALYHLLLRLDLTDWWSSRNPKAQNRE